MQTLVQLFVLASVLYSFTKILSFSSDKVFSLREKSVLAKSSNEGESVKGAADAKPDTDTSVTEPISESVNQQEPVVEQIELQSQRDWDLYESPACLRKNPSEQSWVLMLNS